jgi:hypothetical protein
MVNTSQPYRRRRRTQRARYPRHARTSHVAALSRRGVLNAIATKRQHLQVGELPDVVREEDEDVAPGAVIATDVVAEPGAMTMKPRQIAGGLVVGPRRRVLESARAYRRTKLRASLHRMPCTVMPLWKPRLWNVA